jgi:hypothetical protein
MVNNQEAKGGSMTNIAAQAGGRIITLHLSPYHAVQGTEEYVRSVMGQVPFHMKPQKPRCRDCRSVIGNYHDPDCELSGYQEKIVTVKDVDRPLAVTPLFKSSR